MGTFLSLFPRIPYDISRFGRTTTYDYATDVLFRVQFLQKIKRMAVAYFPYRINPGDTPDIVAEKIYGDPEAYWIIMMVNDIIDPHLDWFMDEEVFERFIKSKYGSISAASTTIHHYEQKTALSVRGFKEREVYTNTTSQIDGTDLQTQNTFVNIHTTIPYNDYTSMPAYDNQTVNASNGQVMEIEIMKNAVTCYEYETTLNESRQLINAIYPESYPQIKTEFEKLVSEYNPARRLNLRDLSL